MIGRVLEILLFKVLGEISYIIYLIQFFYIQVNFPQIGLFSDLGAGMYDTMKQLDPAPWWYLLALFWPGVLFWGAICFIFIEKPGMKVGKFIISRINNTKNK